MYTDLDETDDFYKRTALHRAAVNNDLVKVQELLSEGVDVNEKNARHCTPLHELAYYNKGNSHYEVAEILLKIGADLSAQDIRGRTPLSYLIEDIDVKILQLFLDFKADINLNEKDGEYNLLKSAAAHNENEEIIQFLINLGFDVNYHNSNGFTPLIAASGIKKRNNLKVVKCLLKNGADMNAVTRKGYTPLIQAARGISAGRKKVSENKWKFLVEHTDFETCHFIGRFNILDFYYGQRNDYLWKIILNHFAKLQSLHVPVHPDLLSSISKKEDYDDYYKQCQEELLLVKSIKLKDSWVTFYNLLVDSRKKLKNYAGNEVMIKDFKQSDCEKKFPIYGASIEENVKKGIRRRELFDKSSIMLSNCLPIFNPCHLIIKDILDLILNKKDLSMFCEV